MLLSWSTWCTWLWMLWSQLLGGKRRDTVARGEGHFTRNTSWMKSPRREGAGSQGSSSALVLDKKQLQQRRIHTEHFTSHREDLLVETLSHYLFSHCPFPTILSIPERLSIESYSVFVICIMKRLSHSRAISILFHVNSLQNKGNIFLMTLKQHYATFILK